MAAAAPLQRGPPEPAEGPQLRPSAAGGEPRGATGDGRHRGQHAAAVHWPRATRRAPGAVAAAAAAAAAAGAAGEPREVPRSGAGLEDEAPAGEDHQEGGGEEHRSSEKPF